LAALVDLLPAPRVSEDVARDMWLTQDREGMRRYEQWFHDVAAPLWRRALLDLDVDALPLRASLELALIRPLETI
jgi:hypothetical protein